VKPALFGLLCVWRRVHFSRQQTLQEYERANSFAPAVAADAEHAALAAPAAHVEVTADTPAPLPANEGREAPPPQLVETAEAPASVAEAGTAEALSEERKHPHPVQLLLKPKVSRLACSTSRPPSCKSRPPPRR
jgi:hypothetical protein